VPSDESVDHVNAENSHETLTRILVVSPWENRWSLGGGAGVSDDFNFITRATALGFDLHFLVPRGPSPTIDAEHFTEHTYPNFFAATRSWPKSVKRLLWPSLFNFVVVPRALALARALRPHVILGHSHYSALPTYVCRELLGIPSAVKLFGVMDLVHTEWPYWKYHSKNLEQIAALKVPEDAWIILDDGTKGDEAALRHGVPRRKIHFLPNGIDLQWKDESYDRTAVRREYGVGDDAFVLLFLARLVESKRPELLIRAMPRILGRSSREMVLIVAGEGPERERCEREAVHLGLGNAIRFLGRVPHDRVPAVMAASDVFVATGRMSNRTIPTCEALVCGLPVVAFDVGDTASVVRSGETGFLIAEGDDEGLAEAVLRLARDEALRARMGENSRTFAGSHFTAWDDRIAMELAVLRSLIRERKSA
jgi:glycosyltransferase involved in cell wall biosynthesis